MLPLLGFSTHIWVFHGHTGFMGFNFPIYAKSGFLKKFWDRNLQNAYTNNNNSHYVAKFKDVTYSFFVRRLVCSDHICSIRIRDRLTARTKEPPTSYSLARTRSSSAGGSPAAPGSGACNVWLWFWHWWQFTVFLLYLLKITRVDKGTSKVLTFVCVVLIKFATI